MAELQFRDTSAAGYDQMVGRLTREVIPTLLRVAHLSPGQRVLDVASGTGLAAEAATLVVGPTGHVTAADISPAVLEKARERLGMLPNVSFPSFDAYFSGVERESGNTGQEYVALPEDVRHAVREAVRRDVADTGESCREQPVWPRVTSC